MTDTLVLKNKLVMPQEGTYLELDQDEMEYVDGGQSILIGKYSSSDNGGIEYLSLMAYSHLACCVTFSLLTFISTVAAAVASPCLPAAILAASCGFVSSVFMSLFTGLALSAFNALEDAIYAMRQGKSYSVYENKFLFIVTGYSVRY